MERFYFLYFLILCVLSIVALLNFFPAFYYSMKLYFYLLANRRDQFKRKTNIVGSLGVGASNPFKWFPYIYNDEDFDDDKIKTMKLQIRLRLKIFLLMFTIIATLLIIDITFI